MEHWLIGACRLPSDYPADFVTPVVSDGTWRWYCKGFTMDTARLHITVQDENFGTGAADFDEIQLFQGPCPVPPTTQCAPAQPVCTGPMACSAGTCL